jgi:hypothetical protein
MKLIITIGLSICQMFSSCSANTTHKSIVNRGMTETQPDLKEKATQLKKAYQKLSSSPYTIKYQQEYFDAFPNSFELFNHLFGYTDKEPLGEPNNDFNSPLKNEAELFVPIFFTLNGIERTKYCNRIIDVSINARWYADGVNYFQHGMQEKVKTDLSLFLELLSKRSEKEAKNFWYFYFDSPHPIKEMPEELQKVKEIDSKMFPLIELALKEVQQAWKE